MSTVSRTGERMVTTITTKTTKNMPSNIRCTGINGGKKYIFGKRVP